MVKWIERIEFLRSEKDVGKGEGRTNEDDEYFDLLPTISKVSAPCGGKPARFASSGTVAMAIREEQISYWLDLGNNAGSGQFVLGQPNSSANRKKKERLLTVAELYPEIVSSKGKENDQPSCSAAEALTRQEPFINQNLVYQALAMLSQLSRRGSLSYQGGFYNLASGQLVPLPTRSVISSGSTRRSCRASRVG